MIRRIQLIAVMAVAVFGFMPAPAARAQGCVLCYTSLAAAGSSAIHAFQLAMLALLIPALLLFVGIFVFILRRGAAADAGRAVEARTMEA